MRINKVVRKLRDELKPPSNFTLDACRHGGMTELEVTGVDRRSRTGSLRHRSEAYERYAKRTEKRARAAPGSVMLTAWPRGPWSRKKSSDPRRETHREN